MPDKVRPRVSATAELPTAPLRVQRGAVVAALRRRPGSRSDLTRRLGLSASSMTRIVHGLIDDGWLVEAGVEAAGIGRPPTILTPNPNAGHVVTVVLGAGRMGVRIVDAAGGHLLSAERQLPMPCDVRDIVANLDDLILEAGPVNRTMAVGFSAPGVVGPTGEVVHAPDLGWTQPVALSAEVRDHFGCTVTADNDVNLMMLAEAVTGLAADVREAVFLYHGVGGIGLGILHDGEILPGAHGAAGEIGLIPVDLAREEGKARLFEASYSVAAIAARLSANGVADVSSPMTALAEAAVTGRDGGLLAELTRAVTRAIGTTCLLLDPELVVIGGALRSVLAERVDALHAGLAGWVPSPPRIELSQLGELELQLAVQTKCWEQLLQEEM